MEPTRYDTVAPAVGGPVYPPRGSLAPSIVGFFAFGATTFMIGAHLAGWYGGVNSPLYLWPLAAAFGGLVQLLAGMWAFRERDGLTAAVTCTWGAFYLAYGALYLVASFGRLALTPRAFPELGFWFIVVAGVTLCCILGALARNVAVVSFLTLLAGASILMAISLWVDSHSLSIISGYIFMGSAVAAMVAATADLLQETFGREVIPLGHTHVGDRLFIRREETVIR